jgi:hypothetical protein
MKRFFSIIICLLLAGMSYAQDIIIFVDGTEQQAKVTEISDTEVRYKLWSNQNGPTRVKKISDIFMIRYANGTTQTFTTAASQRTNPTTAGTTLQPMTKNNPYLQQSVITPAEGPWLLYGLNIKEGINMYIKGSAVVNNTKYKSAVGLRFLPNVEAFIEFAPKQRNMPNERRAAYFGIQYAFRGGTISSNVKNTPVDLNLQYLCFRPAYSFSSRSFYSRTGMELGVLTKSTYGDVSDAPYDIRDECNKATFGIWQEFGGVIKDHFTIGASFEYILSNSTKNVWNHSSYSPHFNIQLSLGWRFNPYKIDKKKVEKIREE